MNNHDQEHVHFSGCMGPMLFPQCIAGMVPVHRNWCFKADPAEVSIEVLRNILWWTNVNYILDICDIDGMFVCFNQRVVLTSQYGFFREIDWWL